MVSCHHCFLVDWSYVGRSAPWYCCSCTSGFLQEKHHCPPGHCFNNISPIQSLMKCGWLHVAAILWLTSPWKVKWLLCLSGGEVRSSSLKGLLLHWLWQECFIFLWHFLHLFFLAYHFPWSRRKLKWCLEVLLLLVSPKQNSLCLLKEIYRTAWGFISHSLCFWSLVPGGLSMKHWMDPVGMLAFFYLSDKVFFPCSLLPFSMPICLGGNTYKQGPTYHHWETGWPVLTPHFCQKRALCLNAKIYL